MTGLVVHDCPALCFFSPRCSRVRLELEGLFVSEVLFTETGRVGWMGGDLWVDMETISVLWLRA